jgi:hypothetical protein
VRRKLIGALALLSLGAAPRRLTPCITYCGMTALQAGFNEASCRDLELLEEQAIQAYSRSVRGWQPAQLCRSLEGFHVIVHPRADYRGAWMQDGVLGETKPVGVLGVTNCDAKLIFVGLVDWRRSALVHELGHVFDCGTGHQDVNHAGWRTRGHCAAINATSKLKDDCDTYD